MYDHLNSTAKKNSEERSIHCHLSLTTYFVKLESFHRQTNANQIVFDNYFCN